MTDVRPVQVGVLIVLAQVRAMIITVQQLVRLQDQAWHRISRTQEGFKSADGCKTLNKPKDDDIHRKDGSLLTYQPRCTAAAALTTGSEQRGSTPLYCMMQGTALPMRAHMLALLPCTCMLCHAVMCTVCAPCRLAPLLAVRFPTQR